MTRLHEALDAGVRDWRAAGYPSAYPAIGEIFEHAIEGEAELEGIALDDGLEALIARIARDDALVAAHDLEALRETLTLDYPSWILALAVGAGKTVLIGAIVPPSSPWPWSTRVRPPSSSKTRSCSRPARRSSSRSGSCRGSPTSGCSRHGC